MSPLERGEREGGREGEGEREKRERGRERERERVTEKERERVMGPSSVHGQSPSKQRPSALFAAA